MKIIKKIGYGLLSLVTLFFYTVSNGFPRSRTFNSIKEKVLKIQKNNSNAPESLILEQPDTPYDDGFASHTSHRSHSSHRSHASHSSGTSGAVRSAPAKKTTPTTTSVSTNPYVQYLTVAEVEMISGLKGIQQTLEPTILHFLQDDGKEILRVKFSGKDQFNNFKSDAKYSPISGIGEVALVGTLQLPIQLLFVKGNNCVEIMTFPKEGLNLYLTLDQMKVAANYISSRLVE
jgi:hypothetical protein